MNPNVSAIREKIANRISDLESLALQATKSSFRQRISRNLNQFIEVDSCILDRIERVPMRREHQALWLNLASIMLREADQEAHSLEKAFRDYGSGVLLIPA